MVQIVNWIDNLYYFRDSKGNEVDVICDNGNSLLQIEIKSGQTVNSDYFKGLEYFSRLSDIPVESSLIYGGAQSYTRNNVQVVG